MNKEFYTAAKSLIDTPDKWLKNMLVADEDGKPTDLGSREATKFCALGALFHIGISQKDKSWFSADWESKAGVCNIVSFNNNPNTTHQMMMDAFDRVIAKSK